MMTPNLDPGLLQAFLAVADNRSFTRAATILNRTQSAVSMQIKTLDATASGTREAQLMIRHPQYSGLQMNQATG